MSISKPLVNASYQYLPSSLTFLKLFVSPTSTLRVKNTSIHILVILLINSIVLIVIWNLFTSGHYNYFSFPKRTKSVLPTDTHLVWSYWSLSICTVPVHSHYTTHAR